MHHARCILVFVRLPLTYTFERFGGNILGLLTQPRRVAMTGIQPAIRNQAQLRTIDYLEFFQDGRQARQHEVGTGHTLKFSFDDDGRYQRGHQGRLAIDGIVIWLGEEYLAALLRDVIPIVRAGRVVEHDRFDVGGTTCGTGPVRHETARGIVQRQLAGKLGILAIERIRLPCHRGAD